MRQIEAETAERGGVPRKMQTIWSDAAEENPRRGRRTGPTEPPAYRCGRRGPEAAGEEVVDAGGKPHGGPPATEEISVRRIQRGKKKI